MNKTRKWGLIDMALITLKTQALTVTLDSVGAVLHSIKANGGEYLWQGDPTYWKRRDANLFPYVGRLTDGKYIYRGREYPMTIHGFCIGTEFAIEDRSETAVSFLLADSPERLDCYPFAFRFRVSYRLEGSRIIKTCTVENRDEKTMHFGLGGHPGFNVPLCGEGAFADWYLEFSRPCDPVRVDLDPENYRFAGTYSPFPLTDGRRIPLTHALFDFDAVVLGGVDRTVSLKSEKSTHSVTVSFPDMPFVGFWHAPHTDAPYVCIEPWVSLPSHSAYVEDLEKQEHLIALPAGETYVNTMTIDIR